MGFLKREIVKSHDLLLGLQLYRTIVLVGAFKFMIIFWKISAHFHVEGIHILSSNDFCPFSRHMEVCPKL